MADKLIYELLYIQASYFLTLTALLVYMVNELIQVLQYIQVVACIWQLFTKYFHSNNIFSLLLNNFSELCIAFLPYIVKPLFTESKLLYILFFIH